MLWIDIIACVVLMMRPLTSTAAAASSRLCPTDIPSDWRQACLSGDLFFASPSSWKDDDGVHLPMIGNGYLGTFVDSSTVYSGGLFNGDARGENGSVSHRATIPSYLVNVDGNLDAVGRALDVRRAVFLRRGEFAETGVLVEERLFASLDRPNVLVHEFEVTNHTAGVFNAVNFTGKLSNAGQIDLTWSSNSTSDGILTRIGTNLQGELGNKTSLAVLCTTDDAPIVSIITPTSTLYTFLTVIVTSLNSTSPKNDALGAYAEAKGNAAVLFSSHAQAWEKRNERGSLHVAWSDGDDNDAPLFLAAALNASLYAIRSSIREDWAYGLSPGGIASNAYHGYVLDAS